MCLSGTTNAQGGKPNHEKSQRPQASLGPFAASPPGASSMHGACFISPVQIFGAISSQAKALTGVHAFSARTPRSLSAGTCEQRIRWSG